MTWSETTRSGRTRSGRGPFCDPPIAAPPGASSFVSQHLLSQGRPITAFFPFQPTTKSLTPWPALWPLTLAMAQPRAALPTQPANGQRLVASLCASPTARRRPLYEGAAAAQATRPARATPLQPSQLRLQARNVSANPSEEIAAALASTMARRLRAKTPCEAQATAPVERSDALGSSWRSCNFHKRFCNST